MNRLIADSGSTKTDWLLIKDSGETVGVKTKGINPFFRTSEDIYEELKNDLQPVVGEPESIFFYGAGIINEERGEVIRKALLQLFPAAHVETHSDVLGASRALFGKQSGIACILGTGSNACLYDGEAVVTGIPPLGFILGDECSGAVLGRKLLGDYFKNVMPADIQTLFASDYAVTQAEVLRRVYRADRPNKYLAGFTPFLSKHIDEAYCRELVTASVDEFFKRNVIQIPDAGQFDLGFVGSVAWHFRDILEAVASGHGFSNPRILKGPIEKLQEYHSTNE